MTKPPTNECPPWRKTPLTLAILAALPGAVADPGASVAGLPPKPVGPEFRVNTHLTYSQVIAAVAMDAEGDFVVTWQSQEQDGSGWGVYAQRYNAAGEAQGTEFRVNTATTYNQMNPAVAMDADGDFVIVWQSQEQDGSGWGVYAQRYSAAGEAQGSEFRVNTYTTSNQWYPAVAMDADGDFVVTWASLGQDAPGYGVYAQRYSAVGEVRGTEFQVNTYTTSHQWFPAVAMAVDGDFVVTWESAGQDSSSIGVYAQRYSAAGETRGTEFQVNTYTTNSQRTPAVAMAAEGDFVVTWSSYGQDGSSRGIYAQRYSTAGVAQGVEFRVNTYTTRNQWNTAVAMDAAGDFVVTWESAGQDHSRYGVYAQRYSSSGAAQGPEFQVNTYTSGTQWNSAVAMAADGHFVVIWESAGQDDTGDIYGQRYAPASDKDEKGR